MSYDPRMFYRYYIPPMFNFTQRTNSRGASRFGLTVRTHDNDKPRDPDPMGWTWEEVADYVSKHSQLFVAQNRLLGLIRDKKLTGLYFVQMDHEGLRTTNFLSNDQELAKDFRTLSDCLQHKARRSSPIQPRGPSLRHIFGGESSPSE